MKKILIFNLLMFLFTIVLFYWYVSTITRFFDLRDVEYTLFSTTMGISSDNITTVLNLPIIALIFAVIVNILYIVKLNETKKEDE